MGSESERSRWYKERDTVRTLRAERHTHRGGAAAARETFVVSWKPMQIQCCSTTGNFGGARESRKKTNMADEAPVTGQSSSVDQQASNQLTNEPLGCNKQSQEDKSCGGSNTEVDFCTEAEEIDQWEGSNSKQTRRDVQDVLDELEPLLPRECFEYARCWKQKDDFQPKELLDFVKRLRQHIQAEKNRNKANEQPSSSSSSWFPFSSSSSSVFSYLSWFPSSFWPAEVNVCCVVTGQTFGVHDLIMEKVKNKAMPVTQVNISDQHNCDIIIVFCPVSCCAGSDVEAAMRATQVATSPKDIILVLMHHTRDPDYYTAGRKCSETFPRVVCEVHLLFHETQSGLLECPQNLQAISDIMTEVNSRGKYRLRQS